MPRALRSALIVVLVAAASVRAGRAATLEERFEHTYPLRPGGSFSLGNVNGDVAVVPWDRPEVHLLAVKHVKAGSAARAREVLRELTIRVAASPAEIAVETRYPHPIGGGLFDWLSGAGSETSVTYRVEVPRGARLRVKSVNSALEVGGGAAAELATVNGPIVASGVGGALQARTVNGAITLSGAAGAVRASSVNGAVEVRFAALPPGAPVHIATTNGAVTVHLPRDARASLDAHSTNGEVDCTLPIQAHGSRRHGLRGEINGGGGPIEIATTNGGIEIRPTADRSRR
jgi:putative adhesin